MTIPLCKDCRFFVGFTEPNKHLGECHRRSPQFIAEIGEPLRKWPFTYANDFCGELVEHELVEIEVPEGQE